MQPITNAWLNYRIGKGVLNGLGVQAAFGGWPTYVGVPRRYSLFPVLRTDAG